MPDPVETGALYADARAFLSELARNNDRSWFEANKARYDARLKRPAERLLADIAPVLRARFGEMVRTKLFRPHRDIRFSEDKTPYHVHLHLMWSLADGRAWMFGLSPDYATAGAGIRGFEPTQLAAWRETVAGVPGEKVARLLAEGGWRIPSPELKHPPQPCPADHPRADLLMRKGLVVWQDGLDAALQADPRAALLDTFAGMAPLMDTLGDLR
ncbi:TIGR02453 family protein [Thetidibacter halocola]|uniref:TIGR02453 family protein n=1 Tax=Thetidibacter halocola TaxID=2827239 RepID=A0A8J7WF98_9RHOB|nr:TIGR02453 family protein [Thetidibacter halocola]MBS0124626.1 TIGR02453 family protein [Thetidibacter halocola]